MAIFYVKIIYLLYKKALLHSTTFMFCVHKLLFYFFYSIQYAIAENDAK